MLKSNFLNLLFGVIREYSSYHSQPRRPDGYFIERGLRCADNGKLTLEEAKAGMPRVASAFSKIDVDNKGYVTLDQIKAMILRN